MSTVSVSLRLVFVTVFLVISFTVTGRGDGEQRVCSEDGFAWHELLKRIIRTLWRKRQAASQSCCVSFVVSPKPPTVAPTCVFVYCFLLCLCICLPVCLRALWNCLFGGIELIYVRYELLCCCQLFMSIYWKLKVHEDCLVNPAPVWMQYSHEW